MALNFPSSPNLNDIYQSGSSTAYQWDGAKWNVYSNTVSNITVNTASYAPLVRKNITYVSPISSGDTFWIADGKIYISKGQDVSYNGGFNTSTLQPSGSADTMYRGIPNAYEVTMPGETGSVVSASMNGLTAFVLFDNGNLWAWGRNGNGQCGVGGLNTPIYMPTMSTTNVSHFYYSPSSFDYATDNNFALIRKTDGYVYGAGYNYQNQMSPAGNYFATWSRIDGIGQNPMFVGPFGTQDGGTIAQKADGTVVVMGRNFRGELGVNSGTNTLTTWTTASGWLHGTSSLTMSAIYANADWFDTSATGYLGSALILLTSGSTRKLMVCGNNSFGQLGIGNTTDISTPQTASLPNHNIISKISKRSGAVSTLHVLTTSGSLYGWGYNGQGQVGDGTTTQVNSPKLLITGGVLDILDTTHVGPTQPYFGTTPIVKKSDGLYYSVGYSGYGQTGNGVSSGNSAFQISGSRGLMRFPNGTNIKLAGTIGSNNEGFVRYAVTTDNRVYAWGYNTLYAIQSENGAATTYPSPVEVTPNAFYL